MRIHPAFVVLCMAACGGGGGMTQPDTELACDDLVDDDNDGQVDCDDTDCVSDSACLVEQCTGGVDDDEDSFVDCEDEDCWGDPVCFHVDDPSDLGPPDGDPSIDIDKAYATLENGIATFYTTFDAAWPPPASAYSWFLYFEIDNDGNSPVAAVTIERHEGVEATVPFGVGPGAITVRQSAAGVWVRINGVPPEGEKYYIESGIQKTNPGTRVTDTVVSAPAPLP